MTYIKNKFHLVMLFFNKAAAEYAKRTKILQPESCSKCSKIFELCVTILGSSVLNG